MSLLEKLNAVKDTVPHYWPIGAFIHHNPLKGFEHLNFKDGSEGHMWICDDYRETSYYNDDCTGITYLQFNMKWGENPNYFPYDGWYAFNDFNSLNGNYNSNKKMVYNIIP